MAEMDSMSDTPTPDLVHLDSGVALAVRRFDPKGEVSGPDILLTHGLASNARLWSGAARHLAAAGHRVVTFDQRGHGQSSKPDSGYDMATVADDLALLIDAIGLDRPIVGGQSWGGNVVIEAAHRHPERMAGAVVVDGGFLHLRRQFPEWDACREALAPPPLAGTSLRQIRVWIDTMAADWPEGARDAILANFEIRDDDTVAPWLTFDRHLSVLRGLWEHEPATRYREIDLPVLAIVAASTDADRDRKAVAVDEAADQLRNGRVVWFQPAHHDVHAQKPTEVAEAVRIFSLDVTSAT
jgi:pimeloyl-ACP methyl ester carboxylesterase